MTTTIKIAQKKSFLRQRTYSHRVDIAALGGSMAVGGSNGIATGPDLTKQQVAMLLFERIPIVWTRRVGNTGGVLIAPKATECRFETPYVTKEEPYISGGEVRYRTVTAPLPNAVKAKYHLVLSDGNIDGVQVRDVFQGRCRVGQFSQSHGKRAGTWAPGNFLTDVTQSIILPWLQSGSAVITNVQMIALQDALLARAVLASTYCGTPGTYQGISTFSFSVQYQNEDPTTSQNVLEDRGFWKRQIHIFVRNGVKTVRLLDNTYGSSNNLADLYLWLMTNDGRTPEQQIDRASLLTAARFMDVNGLFWNGELSEPTSISDWINSVGRYFLVRETKTGGRYGLRPLLPVTSTGAIDTAPLTPDWVFDNNAIEPGSYSLSFRDAESRRPFRGEMAWRQQGDDGLSGINRSTPVFYYDTPGYAPIEEHNLTQFCTSEIHTVRAGLFEQAKRRYCTHTASVTVVPGAYDARLGEGDLIALQLAREDLDGVDDPVREWYTVTSLSASREGRIMLDLEHFPVDSLGRSLVALDVASAAAAGDQFITGDSGPSCDEDPSRATNTSVPAEDALSRTKEEVYFFNKSGRFPDNNEYAAPANPPQSGGGGGGGGAGGGGAGNGGAQPPAQSPTQPNNPFGPPNWPIGPTGGDAEGKPAELTPPVPTGPIAWLVIMVWKHSDGSFIIYDESVPLSGALYLDGFDGRQAVISVINGGTKFSYATNPPTLAFNGFDIVQVVLKYRYIGFPGSDVTSDRFGTGPYP